MHGSRWGARSRWTYSVPAQLSGRDVRASDADREAVVDLLREHTGAGRLTLTEFEERAASAYAATRLAELDLLLKDLPATRTTKGQVLPVVLRAVTVAVWVPWFLTAVLCLVIWGGTSLGAGKALYFWPVWVIAPWGIVLLSATIAGRAALRHRRALRGTLNAR